jgi:hypothetical protein
MEEEKVSKKAKALTVIGECGKPYVLKILFAHEPKNFELLMVTKNSEKDTVFVIFLKLYFPKAEGVYKNLDKADEKGDVAQLSYLTDWCERSRFWFLYYSLIPTRFWLDHTAAGLQLKKFMGKEDTSSTRSTQSKKIRFKYLPQPKFEFPDLKNELMLKFCDLIGVPNTFHLGFRANELNDAVNVYEQKHSVSNSYSVNLLLSF